MQRRSLGDTELAKRMFRLGIAPNPDIAFLGSQEIREAVSDMLGGAWNTVALEACAMLGKIDRLLKHYTRSIGQSSEYVVYAAISHKSPELLHRVLELDQEHIDDEVLWNNLNWDSIEWAFANGMFVGSMCSVPTCSTFLESSKTRVCLKHSRKCYITLVESTSLPYDVCLVITALCFANSPHVPIEDTMRSIVVM